MTFHFLKNIEPPCRSSNLFEERRPRPPPSLLRSSCCITGAWAEIEIMDNDDSRFVIAKVLDSDGFRDVPVDKIVTLGKDRALFKYQHPFDRHVMTTVGARFVIEVTQHWRHKEIPRFALRELSYGLETWDRGFKW